ncbi:uroporphyrinogen-III synthase [Bacillus cytotoxicus]|uniref:Uroporphyrinogen-III synthase n=1 Tax=Bacillus cytotoxicus TaxID=580165 RepID=A0ACC6A8A6_9BACI|nr:uroporphyrinogen-III synthase [Bacillus cytotoxicus]
MTSLCGKTVLITRAQQQAKQMSTAVQKQGGIPVEIPLLHITAASHEQFQQVREELSTYEWIIFTSKNGVDFFLDGVKQPLPCTMKIAAVGAKTKQELEHRGYDVHFVPTAFVAEAFAKEFVNHIGSGARILLPKGNLARDVIREALRNHGAIVRELVVYETAVHLQMREQLIDALQSREIDVITFTSPSTVQSFLTLLEGENWREWIKGCTIACIGPITEQEARQYFQNLLVPKEYTIESMLQCISEYI